MNNKKKIVASIEARMNSSRLPGKVLMEIDSKPALQILIERVSNSEYIDEIIIATTINESDSKIEELGNKLNVATFRGSEDDVLDRVVRAVKSVKGEIIVEITGDCPLIDPLVIDYVVEQYLNNYPKYDYVTNIGYVENQTREIPIGMDVRVFTFDNLNYINGITNDPEDREHVSLYFFRGGKEKYNLYNVATPDKWKREHNPRLSLDTLEDFKVIRTVYEELSIQKCNFGLEEILKFFDRNKNLFEINSNVIQRTVSSIE